MENALQLQRARARCEHQRMMDERELTTDQLVDAWRQAEMQVNGTGLGTKEHNQALRRSDDAREAYRLRLDVMKEDLRYG